MPQTAAPIKSAGPFSMVAGSGAAERARMAGGFVVTRNSISKVVSSPRGVTKLTGRFRGMDAK
jgi:hypothetical protein